MRGDFIAVHADPVSVTDSIGVAQNVTLLARPQGTGQPFPSPGGDYFRLNCDRRRHLLSLRALALASIRNYFAAHDFLEVKPCSSFRPRTPSYTCKGFQSQLPMAKVRRVI